jgi:preprotein translocase subunit SecA
MRIQRELAEVSNQNVRNKKIAAIEEEIKEKKKVVLDAGGLYVLGTERHESRRIDNQLRGRAGRQGDPGDSKFFVCLEDDLMRIFGSERMDTMLRKLGLEDGEAIIHPWINKALEKAQQKVEARNFDIRKQLLKYDDVMNDQRKVIYEQRKDLMRTEDVSSDVTDMRHQIVEDLVATCIPENAYAEQWDTDSLHEECMRLFGIDLPIADWAAEEGIADEEIEHRINAEVDKLIAKKAVDYGPELMRMAEKSLLLQILDQCWKEHLLQLDHLRQGISLRAYAQRDPLNEYKSEAFTMFEQMLGNVREMVTNVLARIELQVEGQADKVFHPGQPQIAEEPLGAGYSAAGIDDIAPVTTVRNRQDSPLDANDPSTWGKVPRNAACPCGSGRKFKHCHGKI